MAGSDILVHHLVERLRADVTILIELGHLDHHQAHNFLTQLPDSSTSVAPPVRRLMNAAPAPGPKLLRAKAMWAYNEHGTDKDLSFSAGDIIEIVNQDNADWWTGRANGREGLFPANYVELLEEEPVFTMPQVGVIAARNIPPAPTRGKKPYKPFGAALHGTDAPPAIAGSTNSVGLQQAAGQEEKKKKYDGLKSTMANSAAGGVGFGAGAAIGGGLVRAIF